MGAGFRERPISWLISEIHSCFGKISHIGEQGSGEALEPEWKLIFSSGVCEFG
jgi:hypothetical protein